MGPHRYRLPAAALTIIPLLSIAVHAHVPYLEGKDYGVDGRSFRVEEPGQSKAFYGWLDAKDDVDTFTIRVSKPTRLYTHTLIPFCREYSTFSVSWAITGPGLPAPTAPLPIALPDGHGALVAGETAVTAKSRQVTHERFSDRDYYVGPELVLQAVEAGLYTLVVWHSAGRTGDYVAVIGEGESFSPADLVKATVNTVKIRQGAELHGPCTLPPAGQRPSD